jgi:hypothetical protein
LAEAQAVLAEVQPHLQRLRDDTRYTGADGGTVQS